VYGSAGEIDAQSGAAPEAAEPGREAGGSAAAAGHRTVSGPNDFEGEAIDSESSVPMADELQELFPKGPPELPADLKMAQVAQLSDVLAYVHDQLALVVDMAVEDRQGNQSHMRVDRDSWQKLLKLEMQLASYLRQIADPQR